MWITSVMEVLFAAAVLSLLADFAAGRKGSRRGYAVGAVCGGAILVSLALLISEWVPDQGFIVTQPTASALATVYLADRFSIFVAFTVLVVGFVVTLYSLRHLGPSDNIGPFYALVLLLMGSLVGVISAGDYLTLFLFWEGMSVAAYGLVSFGRGQLSLEATMKYFFMAGIGSLLALYGISVINAATGSIALGAGLTALGSSAGAFGLAVLIMGLGVEAAIVPLHTWLPDVYAAAPLPSASLISGAVTGVGVFAILKILQPLVGAVSPPSSILDIQILLAALAVVTMLVGNLSGLAQTNLRRILSFSSVAQTGYMLAALSTLSFPGLVAVVFTIWNHSLLKSNFFMLLGKENSAYENAELEKLKGSGRQDRPLGFLYASNSLAMMGAPPFGMFWSEILVVWALLSAQTGPFFFLAVIVVGNILLSIGYYYKIINTVVFGKGDGSVQARKPADLAPPALMLLLSLATGLLPFLLLNQLV
ncbi:MAG TPA: proton-conducting transporter membrane subunit [Nitrososphaerales archaeon]|nr:proton-conducting transporter membrane subunit [Nitrososphaerales archaeon]